MSKLDASVYEVAEVKAACDRAQFRYDNTGDEYEVWVDPDCPQRTFTEPAGEKMPGKVCVFSTADGGKLL